MSTNGEIMTRLFAALLLTACAPKTDDGFSAKVAAGCHSTTECEALQAEAEHRYKRCTDVTGRVQGCEAQLNDRQVATQAKTALEQADDNAKWAERRASQAHDSQEQGRLRADLERLGSSCADLAELERTASEVRQPVVAEQYRTSAKERSEARVRALLATVTFRSEHLPSVSDTTDLATLRAELPVVRKVAEDVRCYNADAFARASIIVDAWTAKVEKSIADEEACRGSTQCMGARAAGPVCKAIANRRSFVEMMAKERSNPSGYVDKVALHDLGQRIQDADVEIPALKSDYQKAAHKPFVDAVCRPPSAQ